MVRGFGLSERGRVRKGNEDAFVCADDLQLFVVADGMGGHNAGEVASQLAVEAITSFIRRSADSDEFSWPYGIVPDLSFDGNRLRTAIRLANRRVFRAAEGHDDYTGMGTTVVSALIKERKLIVGHVGDSRLYLHANGALRRATKDDSWIATILAHDSIDKVAAAHHPMRNVLTNVLGAREQTEIHLVELPLRGGEVLLLCTDGLHGVLDDEQIERLLLARGEIEDVTRGLVEAALAADSRDNITALVVRCDGVGA